jgi:hypothetical protein
LHFAESVGGRAEKIAGVEFGEKLAVSRGGLGIVVGSAKALAEPEQSGLPVDTAQCTREELPVFRDSEVIHFLSVECIGLLEGKARRIIRAIGWRGADRLGAVRGIHHGCSNTGGRGLRRDRFRATHFGLDTDRLRRTNFDRFLGKEAGWQEQESSE